MHSLLLVLFLLTVYSFSVFSCKEYNQSDFWLYTLTIWWCSCVESSLVLLEEGVCYNQCVLLAKLCSPLPCFISYSKAKLGSLHKYPQSKVFIELLECWMWGDTGRVEHPKETWKFQSPSHIPCSSLPSRCSPVSSTIVFHFYYYDISFRCTSF